MAHVIGTVIVFVLAIFVIAALVGPTATLLAPISGNLTASTTTHSSNISQAPIADTIKATAILQLFPVFLVTIGLLFVAKLVNPGSIFEGETEAHPYTKADFGGDDEEPEVKPEHYFPPWNCSNCAGPNPEGHAMCQYCGEAYSPRAVKYS